MMKRPPAAMALPPIVKSIEVERTLDEAFQLFTVDIAEWWPLASHSVGGPEATWCGIEGRVGGRVYERTAAGAEHVWGTITIWHPPHRAAFTWHPGQPAEPHTDIEIRFTAIAGDRTRIELEHRNWEAIGVRAKQVHGNYDAGWDVVLGDRLTAYIG